MVTFVPQLSQPWCHWTEWEPYWLKWVFFTYRLS